MCLRTQTVPFYPGDSLSQLVLQQKKIADQDIVVYKHLLTANDKYVTPYRGAEYTRGESYRVQELGIDIIRGSDAQSSYMYLLIREGLHAYTDKYMKLLQEHSITGIFYKMYIPKGSIYYLSANEYMIVSDTLEWRIE